MKPVKTHTFNGVKYHIRFGEIDGWCDPPQPRQGEYPAIFLFNEDKKDGLITIIHECLHAENYNTHEKTVERVSEEIGNFLWRLGYRKRKV